MTKRKARPAFFIATGLLVALWGVLLAPVGGSSVASETTADISSAGDPSKRFFVVGVISGNVQIAVLFDKVRDKSITLETGKRLPGMPEFFLKQAERRKVIIEKVGDHNTAFQLSEVNNTYRYADADNGGEDPPTNFLEKFYQRFSTTGYEPGVQVGRFTNYGDDTTKSRFDVYAPERFLWKAADESGEDPLADEADGYGGYGDRRDYRSPVNRVESGGSDRLPNSYDYSNRYRGRQVETQDSWLDSVTDDDSQSEEGGEGYQPTEEEQDMLRYRANVLEEQGDIYYGEPEEEVYDDDGY